MIDRGKRNVLGVGIDVVDYEAAVERIISAAVEGRPYPVSALAVHGVMTGRLDPHHRYRLNSMPLVVPDGQPVRWALRFLHGEQLSSRVYGPELTLRLCAAAARNKLPIYFYGSRPEVLSKLASNLTSRFPDLIIAGSSPSRFRKITDEEGRQIAQSIAASGARIVFAGLGCPRQEVWAFENAPALSMPVIAVGAAFDFHSGLSRQAPPAMQDSGLEWLFRLWQEPRRLWRRYLLLNPLFCWDLLLQWTGMNKFPLDDNKAPADKQNFG